MRGRSLFLLAHFFEGNPTVRRRSTTQFDIFLIAQCLLGLLISSAIMGMSDPEQSNRVALSAIATTRPRPTPSATVDWWSDIKLASAELPQLWGIPAVSLKSISKPSGYTPDLSIPIATLFCPTETVRINHILTANRPGWWNVSGTAAIDNFWYWKVELSSDGNNWQVLHSGHAPVTTGLLLEFLTTTVERGTYQLRLMAVDKQGNYPDPCVIRITI